MSNKTILDVPGKIPLEIHEETNGVYFMRRADEEIKKENEKASTRWNRAEMLEMIAWYLVPIIYILFTLVYFIIYLS